MSDTRRDTAQWVYRLLTWIGLLLLVLTVTFLLVLPTLLSWLIELDPLDRRVINWMRVVEPVQISLMHGLTLGWLFCLGGCFASFLNVVAWRVPRGRTITGSSHCPACDRRLSFWDNLPVVGWLRNAGSCRQCGEPISARYLLAEVVLGSVFVLLGAVVLLTGGANWPFHEVPRLVGFEHLLFDPDWFVIGVLAWHLTLLCFLFTLTLIESDGLPVPRSIVLTAIVLVIAASYASSQFWLVSWDEGRLAGWLTPQSCLTYLFGGAAGGAVGWLARRATAAKVPIPSGQCPSALAESFFLVGMFLGWQSTLSVGTLTLGLCFIQRLCGGGAPRARVFGPTACTFVATVIHLLCWRFLYS